MAQAALDAAPLRDEQLLVARLKRDVSARLASPTARRSRRRGRDARGRAFGLWHWPAWRRRPPSSSCVRPSLPLRLRQQLRRRRTQGLRNPAQPRKAVVHDPARELPSNEPVAESSPAPMSKPAAVEPVAASSRRAPASCSAARIRRDGTARWRKPCASTALCRSASPARVKSLCRGCRSGDCCSTRLGDSRGALVQFNSYLASPGGGALRESAMVGRALALGRMGRTAEERAAWQALLEAWPKSTHRKRARARLAELDGGDGAGAGRAPSDAGTRRGTE